MLALLSAMLSATLRAALEKERQLSENAHMNAQPRAKAHSQQCTTVRQLARQERILYVLRPSINDDEAIAVRALAMAGFTVGVYFIGRTHDMDMSHYRAFHNDTSGQGPAGERPYGDEWLPELAHVHFKARAAAANASEDVDELLHAVSEWRPALVLPDSQQAVTLLQKAAKAAVTAPAHSAAGASMAAAIACVRCSISPPQHHHRARSKLALMQYARSLSPPVPAPRGFVLTSSVAELAATLRAEMVKAGLPPNATVVLKSDSDGGGSGVKICGSASATALSLSDCLEAITKTRGRRGRMKIRMEVQEFLRGVTTSCVATALAGRVLSGYCVVKQLTAKRGIDCMMSVHHAAGKLNLQSTGASVVIRTYNDPAAFASLAAIIAATQHTGVASADFIVHPTNGHPPMLIDYNPRMSFFATLSPAVLGLRIGPLRALFEALDPRAPRSLDPVPSGTLPHTVTVAKFRPYSWSEGGCVPNWLLCPDVLLDVPWEDTALIRALNRSSLAFDPASRQIWHRQDPLHTLRSDRPVVTRRALTAKEAAATDPTTWFHSHQCRGGSMGGSSAARLMPGLQRSLTTVDAAEQGGRRKASRRAANMAGTEGKDMRKDMGKSMGKSMGKGVGKDPALHDSLFAPDDAEAIGFEFQLENIRVRVADALTAQDWIGSVHLLEFNGDSGVLLHTDSYTAHSEMCGPNMPMHIFCWRLELVTNAVALAKTRDVLAEVRAFGTGAARQRSTGAVVLHGAGRQAFPPPMLTAVGHSASNLSSLTAVDPRSGTSDLEPLGFCTLPHATVAVALADVHALIGGVLLKVDPRTLASAHSCTGTPGPRCKRAQYWKAACQRGRGCLSHYLAQVARVCDAGGFPKEYCGFLTLVVHQVRVLLSAPRADLMRHRYAKYMFDAATPPLALPFIVRTNFAVLWQRVQARATSPQQPLDGPLLLEHLDSVLGPTQGLDAVLYADGFNAYPFSFQAQATRELLRPAGLSSRAAAVEWLLDHEEVVRRASVPLDPPHPEAYLPTRNLTVRAWVTAMVTKGRDLLSDHDGMFRGEVGHRGSALKVFSSMGAWQPSATGRVHLEFRGDLVARIPVHGSHARAQDRDACVGVGANRGSVPLSAALAKLQTFADWVVAFTAK